MKIAVYPGSFDPITNGHLDIIRRAGQMFDRVIVAVAINTEKKPLFSVDERRQMVTDAVKGLRNMSVDQFEGLLIQYARRKRATAVVRGLRAVSDFEFEFQLALMNRKLDPSIETIFLMTKDEYMFISSRPGQGDRRTGRECERFCAARCRTCDETQVWLTVIGSRIRSPGRKGHHENQRKAHSTGRGNVVRWRPVLDHGSGRA